MHNDYFQFFEGKEVIILPDNDVPGREHANKIANALYGKAKDITIVELPDLKDSEDIIDWQKQGGTRDEFHKLIKWAPAWSPPGGDNSPFSINVYNSTVKAKHDRVNAGELQRQALDPNRPPIPYLPLLGKDGFIVNGFSHLLASYPKCGKTTLLAQMVLDWSGAGTQVLYLTEEPQLAWEERLRDLPAGWDDVSFIFALGMDYKAILQAIKGGDEEVVIIDTLRLLGIADENDNACASRAQIPLIMLCRNKKQTLIFAHHTNKVGGNYGKAIAGAHAIFGNVDIALELQNDGHSPKRRKLKGYGRIIEVPELIYELQGKELVALGSPEDLSLEELKGGFQDVLSGDWQKTQELITAIEDPRPSTPHALKALEVLVRDGVGERNPPIGTGSKKGGKGYQWRLKV